MNPNAANRAPMRNATNLAGWVLPSSGGRGNIAHGFPEAHEISSVRVL